MIRTHLLGLATVILATASLPGQDAHEVEMSLMGHPLALRSYSADNVTQYTLVDGVLASSEPGLRTLAIFTTESVKDQQSFLEIDGQRSTLVEDGPTGATRLVGSTSMKLEVPLSPSGTAWAVDALQKQLFFPDYAAAIAGVPVQFTGLIPYKVEGKPSHTGQHILEHGEWRLLRTKDSLFKNPQVLSTPSPKFSKEARKQKVGGNVVVALALDEQGSVRDLWIGSPLGFGLEEQAVEAVRKYRFRPATYNGSDVGMTLQVVTNFRVY